MNVGVYNAIPGFPLPSMKEKVLSENSSSDLIWPFTPR